MQEFHFGKVATYSIARHTNVRPHC